MRRNVSNEEPGRFSRHHHPKTEKDRKQGREQAGKPGSGKQEERSTGEKHWREVLETVQK
jgi:hypothetical protein